MKERHKQKQNGSEVEGVEASPDEREEELFLSLTLGAKLKHFLILTLFKAVGKFVAMAPEKASYRFCVTLALLGYRYFPKYRRLAREQLQTAFGGEKSPEEIEAILRQTYINQGKNLAEFLMIPHKSAEWINGKIRYNDPNDFLRSELKKGRGVVAVGAHIGNLELVCAWLGVNGFPMVTVVKAQRDALFTQFIMQTRLKWGSELVFRQRGVKKECLRQLGMNKIVGLVADQNAGLNAVFVDYFGKKAGTVTGPADIAMQSGLPVIPSFMTTRNADDTLTLHVLDPIPMRDTGDRQADIEHNVQLFTTAIEEFVRKYPAEYLWWHRRWKTRPQNAA